MPPDLKAVGIRELKNHLSAYLKEVSGGTTIMVLDRNKVVGELRQPRQQAEHAIRQSLEERWAEEGRIIRPSLKKTSCPASVLQAPAGTAARLLEELRGE